MRGDPRHPSQPGHPSDPNGGDGFAGDAVGLIVARAPVPGESKTRLAAVVGADAAADLAAAALLDTLGVLCSTFATVHVSLTGDLSSAARGRELRDALARCEVSEQQGETFGRRLAHAHRAAGRGGRLVVQVGMDTPQLRPADLLDVVRAAGDDRTAVLGEAVDGGWWVLGLREPGLATALVDVPMSRPTTCADTEAALRARGAEVRRIGVLRDVDEVADAAAVALAAPRSRFAAAWRAVAGVPG